MNTPTSPPPKKQFKRKLKKVIHDLHYYRDELHRLNMQAGAFDNEYYPHCTKQFQKNVWKYANNRVDSDSEEQEAWLDKFNVYEVELPEKTEEEEEIN